jgi:hypothetical protein
VTPSSLPPVPGEATDDLAARLAAHGDQPIPLFGKDVAAADPAQVSLFGFPLGEAS